MTKQTADAHNRPMLQQADLAGMYTRPFT